MKKFISAACIIALIALVPAVFVGYLHNDTHANKNNTEIVKDDVTNSQNESSILRLVKTF